MNPHLHVSNNIGYITLLYLTVFDLPSHNLLHKIEFLLTRYINSYCSCKFRKYNRFSYHNNLIKLISRHAISIKYE